jgi:DNA-binding IclR family transcriptional regulator
MSNTSPVQSVDRAITVLEILAAAGEVGVTDIAARLDVHKSTAFRLVTALEQRGLVEQVEGRGKYRLGFGIIQLAGATTARMDLVQYSRSVCQGLAEKVGETVNVAVLRGTSVVNLDQVRGDSAISAHNWIGQATPLHATSSGKVLLAHQGSSALERLLSLELAQYTERTRTDRAALLAELDKIRKQGWACTEQELEVGLNALAAPIWSYGHQLVGAVSVSGPSYRLASSQFTEIADVVVAAAAEISARLGFVKSKNA